MSCLLNYNISYKYILYTYIRYKYIHFAYKTTLLWLASYNFDVHQSTDDFWQKCC